MVSLLDASGELVAFNDDFEEFAGDSQVSFSVPEDGTYYAFVHGYPNFPEDPFDSASGDGAGSEGDVRGDDHPGRGRRRRLRRPPQEG